MRFHTDAVQAVGRVPVSFAEWPVDLLSLSAHKLHGPKGAAALLVRRGVKLRPVVQGGGQERGLRPGTENLAGIVGLATALRLAFEALDAGAMDRVGALRDRLEAGILAALPDLLVNGPRAPSARVPNTLNVSFAGAEAEGALIGLDRAGVAASSGSACSSGSVTPSPVLTAMGLAPARIASSNPPLALAADHRGRGRSGPRGPARGSSSASATPPDRAARAALARAGVSRGRARGPRRRWRGRCPPARPGRVRGP